MVKHRKAKKVVVKSSSGGAKISRMPTGIAGLDRLVDGGFMPGSAILVSGGPGVGKSIFCYQYVWEGLKNGEPCMFVSFEAPPDKVRKEAGDFGWDFAKYEKEGKLLILHVDPTKLAEIDISKYRDVTSTIIKDIQARAMRIKAKRIAIDPVSVFGLFLEGKAQVRRRTYEMVQKLIETGATIVMTCEHHESGTAQMFGVETYVADGLIILYYVNIGADVFGNIEIRKMRRTDHAQGLYPTKITNKGLEVGKETVSIIK